MIKHYSKEVGKALCGSPLELFETEDFQRRLPNYVHDVFEVTCIPCLIKIRTHVKNQLFAQAYSEAGNKQFKDLES